MWDYITWINETNKYTMELIKLLYTGPSENSPMCLNLCILYQQKSCASFLFGYMYYTLWTIFNSRGFKASWTISWTVRFLRQTSESSSIGAITVLMLAPDAISDNVCKNLVLSTSVTAVFGINEMLPLAHSRAFVW